MVQYHQDNWNYENFVNLGWDTQIGPFCCNKFVCTLVQVRGKLCSRGIQPPWRRSQDVLATVGGHWHYLGWTPEENHGQHTRHEGSNLSEHIRGISCLVFSFFDKSLLTVCDSAKIRWNTAKILTRAVMLQVLFIVFCDKKTQIPKLEKRNKNNQFTKSANMWQIR